jgi:uncharacterized membrane protein
MANFLLEVLDQLQISLFPFGSILNLLQNREISLLKTFVVGYHLSTILFRSLQVSLKALRLQNKFLPFVIHSFTPNFHVPNNLRKVFVCILKVSDIAESFLQFVKYRNFFIHGLRSHIVQLILNVLSILRFQLELVLQTINLQHVNKRIRNLLIENAHCFL